AVRHGSGRSHELWRGLVQVLRVPRAYPWQYHWTRSSQHGVIRGCPGFLCAEPEIQPTGRVGHGLPQSPAPRRRVSAPHRYDQLGVTSVVSQFLLRFLKILLLLLETKSP